MSHAIKKPSPFRMYGAIFVFLVMWWASEFMHFSNGRDAAVQEAQSHGQQYKEDEYRSEWLRDSFENHKSEYAQLFFQSLLIVALARFLFYKEQQNFDEIKDMLEELKGDSTG